MKSPLSERQNQAYEFIRAYMKHNVRPPTMKEIGEGLGMRSTNGVFKLLAILEEKGYITRQAGMARGLSLVDGESDSFGSDVPMLPVAGRASSYDPDRLLRTRNYMCIDPLFIRKSNEDDCLIVRAGDDGLSGSGIQKGDYLIVEKAGPEMLLPDIPAVFLVGEQAIARRFSTKDGTMHLVPTNRSYTEAFYPLDSPECFLVGRIIGVLRTVV